jgi:hypothetical protein
MELTTPREEQRTHLFLRTLLSVLTGPLIWAAHFLVIYGANTILFTQGASGRSREFVIGAATLLALAVLAIALRSKGRAQSGEDEHVPRFLRNLRRWLAGLAALGILWAGSTILILPTHQVAS